MKEQNKKQVSENVTSELVEKPEEVAETSKPGKAEKFKNLFKAKKTKKAEQVEEAEKVEETAKDAEVAEDAKESEEPKKEEVIVEDTANKTVHQSIEVRLEGLTKVFVDKTKKETRAVDNFNVVIPAGKLIGLLGPSGCGKSTTLYMIAGLHKPTSGKIFFGEEDVTFMPPEKRGIGLVFQNYALYPHLTVKQNIMFPLQNMKMEKEKALALAQEMAELVHIGDLMERKPAQLSGGQQQRVAIARALVKKPRVLLLDEPLSNLDARLRLQTREEIRRIQKETGITTIFVTHDQEEAMSISDEIVVMNYGVQQQKDEPQRVYEEPVNQFVAKFLGNPPINIIEGKIENHEVKLLNGTVLGKSDAEDQDVRLGVRPEFFTLDENLNVDVHVGLVEHIGRDTLALATIKGYEDEVRILVPSHKRLSGNTDIKIGFRRFFVFDHETGERIQ